MLVVHSFGGGYGSTDPTSVPMCNAGHFRSGRTGRPRLTGRRRLLSPDPSLRWPALRGPVLQLRRPPQKIDCGLQSSRAATASFERQIFLSAHIRHRSACVRRWQPLGMTASMFRHRGCRRHMADSEHPVPKDAGHSRLWWLRFRIDRGRQFRLIAIVNREHHAMRCDKRDVRWERA